MRAALIAPERVAAVERTELIGSPAEDSFDGLTRLLAAALDVPMAGINVIASDRQYLKSHVGLGPAPAAGGAPLDVGLCPRVVGTGRPLFIADTRRAESLRRQPALLPTAIVAYAGVPVRGPEGAVVGTVFAADRRPRRWTRAQRALMDDVARSVTGEIELRAEVRRRRAAESAAAEGERRVRAVLEATPDCVKVVAPDGELREINPAGAAMLDLTPEQAVGRNVLEWVDPAHHAEYRAASAAALKGEAARHRFVVVGASGQRRWLEAHRVPLRDAAGRITAVLSVSRDVVDRRRSQAVRAEAERAEKQQRRLAAILEAAPNMIASWGIDGRLHYVNPLGRRMLGLEEDEDVSSRRIERFHPRWVRDVLHRDAIPTARRHGLWQGESALLDAEGREIPVSQVIIAHAAEASEPEYFSTIIRDLSEKRQLEEQLSQSQRLEAVGQLAGGVAHDFNNILTAINGNVQLLLEETPDADPRQGELLEIRKSADRATNLTRQLLAFSRRQVLQPRVIDLRAVLADMQAMLHRLIGEHVLLVMDAAEDAGNVRADAGQVEQVLLNLAVNARDAMPAGGRLTFRVGNAEISEDAAKNFAYRVVPGPYIRLLVEDTGCGMSPAVAARIFEPFYTTKQTGTGLGLATVYGIIKQSNGYVWVRTEEGVGTTFEILLPRAEGPAAELRPAFRRSSDSDRGTETVLLVEDEVGVRNLARRILQRKGYTLLEAQDGVAALEVLEARHRDVDLVVTDMVMPEMNGRDFVERLRKLHPEVRVLYMSGYSYDTLRRDGELDEGDAFIEKPFSPESFAHKVRSVLDAGAVAPA